MSSSVNSIEATATVKRVWFEENFICLELNDGREVRTPLSFYPRLLSAKPSDREDLEIIGLGTGIHWGKLDEDLSVEGILLGRPSFSR